MAEVYRRPIGVAITGGGDPLNWVIARHRSVQTELARVANERAAVARTVVAAHRKTGATQIKVEHHDVDYHVVLHDRSPRPDAMAIETGARDGRGGIKALGIAFPESYVYFIGTGR